VGEDSGDVNHLKPVQADQGIPVLGGQYGRNFQHVKFFTFYQ
jgi:hypothetical protein